MPVVLHIVACLAAAPHVCETVFPDRQPATFFECIGPTGQGAAAEWLVAHPGHRLGGPIRCSVGGTLEQIRARVEDSQA